MVGTSGRIYATRCHVCRRRKVKCDGKEPFCNRCQKAGFRCTGYQRSVEVVFFDEQSLSSKTSTSSKGILIGRTVLSTTTTSNHVANSKEYQDKMQLCTTSPIGDSPTNRSLSVPQYRICFIGVLQGRFVPDLDPLPNRHEESVCSTWIDTACELAPNSEMLSDALLAMSLTIVGGELHEKDVTTAGLRYYSNALQMLSRELQASLLPRDEYHVDRNLVTCLACGVYEWMANQSFDAFSHHLQGLGALLKKQGVSNLRSSTSRRIFYEYRALAITISLMTRHSSFLSLPEWINPPWRYSNETHPSLLHSLIDAFIHLPSLMERWDNARVSQEPMTSTQLNSFIQDTLQLQLVIHDWETKTRASDQSSQIYFISYCSSLSDIFPELQNTYPVFYHFATFDIGVVLMYHQAIQIYIYELLLDMILYSQTYLPNSQMRPNLDTEALVKESVECADKIARSLEYFFHKDKRLVGPMVIQLPFLAAKGVLRRCCQMGTGDNTEKVILKRKLAFCEWVEQRIKAGGLLLKVE